MALLDKYVNGLRNKYVNGLRNKYVNGLRNKYVYALIPLIVTCSLLLWNFTEVKDSYSETFERYNILIAVLIFMNNIFWSVVFGTLATVGISVYAVAIDTPINLIVIGREQQEWILDTLCYLYNNVIIQLVVRYIEWFIYDVLGVVLYPVAVWGLRVGSVVTIICAPFVMIYYVYSLYF